MKQKAIGFLFVLMITIPLYAQEKSISLGGADLRLGMTVEQVLKVLDDFDVTMPDKDRGNALAVVWTPKGKHEKTLGTVQFTAGKLTYVSAEREEFGGNSEAITFAKRLFSLLSLASDNGKKFGIAHVSTKFVADMNWSMKFVGITVGSKNILIRISDIDNKDFAAMEEELGFFRQEK